MYEIDLLALWFGFYVVYLAPWVWLLELILIIYILIEIKRLKKLTND